MSVINEQRRERANVFFLGFVDEFGKSARGLELAARHDLEHSGLHVEQARALLGAAGLDLEAGEGRAVRCERDEPCAISSLTPGDARRESRGSRCRRRPRGRRIGGSGLQSSLHLLLPCALNLWACHNNSNMNQDLMYITKCCMPMVFSPLQYVKSSALSV